MKQLSKDVVNTVMEFLILTFGKTTSLDVKQNLRKLGFEATQKDVSTLMAEIFADWEDGSYEYVLDGAEVELTVDHVRQGTLTFKAYSFQDVEEEIEYDETDCDCDDDCENEDCACDCHDTIAPVAPITTVNPKDYIRRNINISSGLLATALGISVGSVAAYKANINR